LVSGSPLGPMARFLLLSDICGLHVVTRPLQFTRTIPCHFPVQVLQNTWQLTVSFETTGFSFRRLLRPAGWRYSNPPLHECQSQSLTLTTRVSKSRYGWRSISQYVLMWFSWPDVCYCVTITVVSLWGVLSDERSGLSIVSQSLNF
jgi:hypothetical protein